MSERPARSGAALSRRRFLSVSATATGGLLVGLNLGGRARRSHAAEPGAKPAPPFAPNAWVTIDGDGVTLTCHRNEMGQDVHTALTMILAEELEVDPRDVRVVQAPVDGDAYHNALLGAQITGGSTSVRDAWDPLRQAGATAREMLVAAAAARWSVDAGSCRADDGHVHHAEKGRLAYTDLGHDAARQSPPEDVALKPASAFRVIGRSLPRLDGADKARGRTTYGIDVVQPGMLHAALVACPVLGGRVRSFDASKVKQRPGVRRVVDLGEAVAVVADHWHAAQQAVDALEVEWDEGPGAGLDDEAIRRRLEQGVDADGAVVQRQGAPEKPLASESALEARYTTQLLAHMTLEPQGAVARVGDDGVDVWASTQYPQGAQAIAAEAAGVDPARVRIHSQMLGGGFGRRLDVDFIGQAVAIAKALPGTPVKLIWSREEDVTHDFYRPPSLHLLRGRVADGRIEAFSHKLISPSVTARLFPSFVSDGIDPFMTEGTANFSYSVPHLDLRTVIQEVGVRVGYWRSVSHAQNAFAIEGFVDELAHASGSDPVDLRLAMLEGLPRQAAVLRRAVEMSGYRDGAAPGHAFGVASMQCYDSHVALVAEVSGEADGLAIEGLHFAVDCGIAIHPDQVVAQIEGAAVTGLIGALRSRITLRDGRVEQKNFDTFPIPRMNEVPPIHVSRIETDEAPGGMGEVGTPLVAPALANAVFARTGRRIRSLPLEAEGVRFG